MPTDARDSAAPEELRALLHYRLVRKLGEGGMGAVYLAEDTRDRRPVALKVLRAAKASDPEFVRRFRREVEAATRLRHPNIVRAFEAGEDRGWHFYAMEYCEGEALDRTLKRRGRLPWSEAAGVILQAARGLEYAHRGGFIHRDVKPANIFLAADGTAKILDLGLARRMDTSQASILTMAGTVLGTPHYISPEQARGLKEVDGRTDLYSLGATLYHMVTGQFPFSGSTLYDILSKHVMAELPNPQDLVEDIPDGLVQVLRKMMAKAPAHRYPDGGALARDLERVLEGKEPDGAELETGGSSVAIPRPRPQEPARRRGETRRVPILARPRPSKPPVLWIGGAAAAALLLIVIIIALSGKKGAPPPKAPVVKVAPPAAPAPPEAGADRALAEPRDRGSRPPAAPPSPTPPPPPPPVTPDPPPPPGPEGPRELVYRVVGKLKELNPGYDGEYWPTVEGGRVTVLLLRSPAVRDLGPIAELKDLRVFRHWTTIGNPSLVTDITPLKGLRLEEFSCDRYAIRDLVPLQGMPLKSVSIAVTRVVSLEPLRGMELANLAVGWTAVSNLGPLRGMPLRRLSIPSTKVTDLSPLEGMKLEDLSFQGTGVTDFGPLRGMPLKNLGCTVPDEKGVEILRSIPTLESINGMPAALFWSRETCFLRDWAVIGPFPAADGLDVGVPHPPDGEVDFAKRYPGKGGEVGWRAVRMGGATVDLRALLRTENCVAYAVAWVESAAEAEAVLHVGSDDGCRVWVNGEMVLEVRKSRGHKAGEDRAAVRLRKGRNEVKVKVAQGVQGWEFSVMITAPDGKPVEGARPVAPLGVK